MKNYFYLALCVFLFGASAGAQSFTTPYHYQYSYQPEVVYVDAALFNTPMVSNPQYGRSTIRKVVPSVYGSRYNPTPTYAQNAARGTTFYAYGQKRYEPQRVQYSRTIPCSY